ncbi:MAG: DUF6261 family protein [Prevotellaceae bacterium]|nr:DUF6261 family protein [Prevotellaceae bacterium]
MKKFIGITLGKFNRGAYFDFMTKIYALLAANPQIAKKAAALLALFAAAIAQVDAALAIKRKSEYTAEIAELNVQRHALLAALKAAVRGFLHIASTQKEATELGQLFKDYGIRRKMQLNQATGLFSNLIADLEGEFAPSIKKMNLQTFVTNLKTANTQLQQLSEERLDDYNANGTARLVEARKNADAAYRQVLDYVEALVQVEGETNYAATIDRVNTEIKHFKQDALGDKVKDKIPGTGGDGQGGDDGEEEPPQG